MAHLVSASILNSDFGQLKNVIELINKSECDWFHLDIMDGVFVPNISFGFPVLEVVKKYAAKPLDVHLMIIDPNKYVDQFKEAGADILTVHFETCPHLHRTIQHIKSTGIKAGVALNPHTPVEMLEEIIGDLDLVLIMTVNPGFGGQSFIENSYSKIERLKSLIQKKNSKAIIEVDGGIDLQNAGKLVGAGVNTLVVGSHIFNSTDPVKTISELKRVVVS
jgi:ribulose-phosphate 3-epimerase